MSVKPTAKPKEIIEEINKLRSNPPLYANKVEEYSKYFTDNIIKLPNLNIKIQTQEGPAPYLETVEYLKGLEKVNELIPSKALCEIAQEFADNVKDSETGEIDEEIHEQIILINMVLLLEDLQEQWILEDSLLNKLLLISWFVMEILKDLKESLS